SCRLQGVFSCSMVYTWLREKTPHNAIATGCKEFSPAALVYTLLREKTPRNANATGCKEFSPAAWYTRSCGRKLHATPFP
ncbi:MAG: hypothetical protein ABIQ11_04900, partial [Saprospiraceae bacterium]